jgi:hypothetical protein
MTRVYRQHVDYGVPLRIPKMIADRAISGVAEGLVDHHPHSYHHFRVKITAEERHSAFYLRLRAEPATDAYDLQLDERNEFLSRYGEWRYSLLGVFIDNVDSVLLSPIVSKLHWYNLEDRLKPRPARDLFDLSVSADRSIPLNCVRARPVSAFFRGLPRLASIGSADLELRY